MDGQHGGQDMIRTQNHFRASKLSAIKFAVIKPIIKFILKSCLTTLLTLAIIGLTWLYPIAVKKLGPMFGDDLITDIFFANVIIMFFGIVLTQLQASYSFRQVIRWIKREHR